MQLVRGCRYHLLRLLKSSKKSNLRDVQILCFNFQLLKQLTISTARKERIWLLAEKKKYQNIYNAFRTWYPLAVNRSALLTWNSNTGSVLALIQEETYGGHVLNKEYPTEKDQKNKCTSPSIRRLLVT